MYVSGFIVPVPEDKKAEYTDVAEQFWEIAKDCGARSQIEAWEDDVKDGQWTDFRRAVDLQPGEKVVFSWVTWDDRAAADAGQAKMMEDPRMAAFGTAMPFDGKRMVFGGFEPIVWKEA